MKSSDIQEIVLEFTNTKENSERAILISGDWGIGKTYYVEKAMNAFNELYKDAEEKKKNKIYYVSLFGAESIEDVQTNVYDTLKPANSVAKKALSVTSAFTNGIEGLHIIGDIADGISLLLRQDSEKTLKKKIKKNVTFIFDDIERTGDNFSYIAFHGLLNSLLVNGVKVVCVCSDEHISDDGELKKEFQEFKEKTFDRVYYIDESPTDIIYSFFKDEKFGLTEYDIISLDYFFDKNIRNANKTAILMSSVLKLFNKKNIDYTKKASNFFLLSSCLFSILIILQDPSFVGHVDQDKKDTTFDAFYIDYESSRDFTKGTHNDFVSFFKNNKDHILTPYLPTSTLVAAIIKYYLYKNERDLIDFFDVNPVVDKNNIKDLRYMSDEDNKDFSKQYIEKIKDKTIRFDTSESLHDLEAFLNTTVYPIDEATFDEIAKCIASEIEDPLILRENGAYMEEVKRVGGDSSFIKILDQAENIFNEISGSDEINIINQFYENKDYYSINMELPRYFRNKHILDSSKIEVLQRIKELGYFLPDDFSGELNKTQWDLCCTVSSCLAGFDDFISDYVSTLESLKEKDGSETATRRLNFLIGNFKKN